MLTSRQITEQMVSYEAAHAVEGYEAFGWRVWPLLRTLLAWVPLQRTDANPSWTMRLGESAARASWRTRIAAYGRVGARFLASGLRDRARSPSPDAPRHDAVILASGGRRQKVGASWTHYVADPLAEALRQRGSAALVWQLGEERHPRHCASAWISSALEVGCKLARRRGLAPVLAEPPAWFAELSPFADECFQRHIPWKELEQVIRRVTLMSHVFQPWLAGSGCRLLLLDCWHAWESLGAALAAHRLGIRTVDVQHGIQEHRHFAYASWTKAPPGGYEAFPKAMWFWGREAARIFNDQNAQPCETIVGGNLWLNQWRSTGPSFVVSAVEQARVATSKCAKSILVTLSYAPEEELEFLAPAIRSAPPNWLWLIRMHPNTLSQRAQLAARARDLGEGRIQLDEGTDMPLYALLRVVNVHATLHSTCALESLAFGVPTVIFHKTGEEAFGKHVDAGVMRFARSPSDVEPCVRACEAISPERCRGQAADLFAAEEESRNAVGRLLELMTPAA